MLKEIVRERISELEIIIRRYNVLDMATTKKILQTNKDLLIEINERL